MNKSRGMSPLTSNRGFLPLFATLTCLYISSCHSFVQAALPPEDVSIDVSESNWRAVHMKKNAVLGHANGFHLIQVQASKGESYAVHLWRAWRLVKNRDHAKAITEYEQALALDSVRFPYYELGDTLNTLGRTDEAIKAYRQSIYGAGSYDWKDESTGVSIQKMVAASHKEDPEWTNAYTGTPWILMKYATLLCQVKRYPEAKQCYLWALEKMTPDQQAIFTLRTSASAFNSQLLTAASHTAAGMLDRDEDGYYEVVAVSEYEKAIAIEPDYAPAYYFMGAALHRDDPERSKAAFQKAAALDNSRLIRPLAEAWLSGAEGSPNGRVSPASLKSLRK